MKKKRDPNSGALTFTRSPEEEKRKVNDKNVEQSVKEIESLKKKIKTIQTNFKKLEKIVNKMKEKKNKE